MDRYSCFGRPRKDSEDRPTPQRPFPRLPRTLQRLPVLTGPRSAPWTTGSNLCTVQENPPDWRPSQPKVRRPQPKTPRERQPILSGLSRVGGGEERCACWWGGGHRTRQDGAVLPWTGFYRRVHSRSLSFSNLGGTYSLSFTSSRPLPLSLGNSLETVRRVFHIFAGTLVRRSLGSTTPVLWVTRV